jgi:hypothetical protein
MKSVIGIDPGKHGAIAVIAPDGLWGVVDMPDTNAGILTVLRRSISAGSIVVLEEQHHRGFSDRLNGKTLTTFMSHYGALQMALASLNVQPITVAPKTWQAELLGSTATGETKDAAMEYANRCIPKLKIKKSQADAVCLALWGKQAGKLRVL